jgi:hypothetical protein
LPLAMLALSAAPGAAAQDQSLPVLQLPVAGFQMQLNAQASCVGKPPRAKVAAMARLVLRARNEAVFIELSPDLRATARVSCSGCPQTADLQAVALGSRIGHDR